MMLDNFPKILDAVKQAASEDSLLLTMAVNLNAEQIRWDSGGVEENEHEGKCSGGGSQAFF